MAVNGKEITMRITREVAITEVWLDEQARLAWPAVPAKVWAAELGKALVWFVGLVLLLLSMALLAPESKADSINVSFVASELDQGTVLPLAGGVDVQLAGNLIQAQNQTWGKEWLDGSLTLSVESVLRAIQLYVWPGGPTEITKDHTEFSIVWLQSTIAIDPRLTGGFDTTVVNFGEQPVVSTPEAGTLVVTLAGLAGLGILLWSVKSRVRELSR